MTSVHSPTAGRRRLRNVLRRARDSAGLTQEQVARTMEWSLSKVIRIETGGVGVSTSDLRHLLRLYRVDDPRQVAELVELARVGRRRPWWTQYKDRIPAGYMSYIGLEEESVALRCVNSVGLPGLLQTYEYALAVAEASYWTGARGAGYPSPAAAADVRMIRQREVLHRPNPPDIVAILDEAVVCRQIGGAEVLHRQLLHLIALGSTTHVTIHVLPFTASRLSIVSPFVILEFPDPTDPDVVYAESTFDFALLDRPFNVENYREMFDWLQAASLSEPESMALIRRAAGELTGSRPPSGTRA
jgi:transcriptional regulator with XRE-family HTH domain